MKRAVSLMVALTALGGVWVVAQPSQLSIADEFRMVEVASVADAIEQLYGERAHMSHQMRPLAASQGMLDAIDAAPAGSVYVMVLERAAVAGASSDDSADYAGIGGLMATAMKYRGFAGAVIDASVRDTPQIRRLQFPVFSRGVVPSTTINHFRVTGVNVPVVCAGVRVNPGEDGVAVVPVKRVPEVLKKAQELDDTEHRMYPFIEKFRSIREAVKQFGRI